MVSKWQKEQNVQRRQKSWVCTGAEAMSAASLHRLQCRQTTADGCHQKTASDECQAAASIQPNMSQETTLAHMR